MSSFYKSLFIFRNQNLSEGGYGRNHYWSNEKPVFNAEPLKKIKSVQTIDTIIPHSSPSFCELQNKNGLYRWACNDAQQLVDVQQERETMDCTHQRIKESQTVPIGAMDTFIKVGTVTLMGFYSKF